MTWIKRKAVEPKPHECETPFRHPRVPRGGSGQSPKPGVPIRHVELTPEQKARQDVWSTGWKIPVGDVGDIWACDTCGQVWIMKPAPPYRGGGYSPRSDYWDRAGRRLQRKYAPRYACGCRIDKPQTKWCKNQPHPGQRMVTVHGAPKARVSRRTVEEIESTPPDD